MMSPFYVRTLWVFGGLRALSVFLHYLGPSPWGGPLIVSPDRFIPEALTIEAGIWGLIVVAGALLEALALKMTKKRQLVSWYRRCFLTFCAVFSVFSQIDFEVTRWLGQHMSASYIANFAGARDGHLLARILSADVLFSSLALFQMTVAPLASAWVWWSYKDQREGQGWSKRASRLLFAFVVLALASPFWLRPSEKRWRRVQPAAIGITDEILRSIVVPGRPHNSQRAHQDLVDFIRVGAFDQGLSPQNLRYPLLRNDNVGRLDSATWRSRALTAKPDIIVVVFETMRGANTGLLGEETDPLFAMPLLQNEMSSHARYFPRMHSAGYPSVAGAMGMHLGVWPHHSKILFSSYLHITTLSFPEMLNAVGYQSLALLGADPSFSNFTPWFRRWYQTIEYNPVNHHDGPLVDRFEEIYDENIGVEKPLLMTLWTATTHPPYDVPKDSGQISADSNEERYLQAMHYADVQIVRLLEHLRASPRWPRTLVFVLGDHSQPTPWQWRNPESIGELSPGHTWTSLAIFSGENIALARGRDDRVVSHVDLGPTILAALDLKADNHFFGRDLLASDETRRVFSFRYGAMSTELDSQRTVFRIDDENYLSYQFNPNDVRSYGALQGGERQRVTNELPLGRYRDMARAWTELLDQDRLAPLQPSSLPPSK